MTVVVADTSPINYLVLIGQIDLLNAFYESVLIPEAVRGELRHADAPMAVQEWIADPPRWLSIEPNSQIIAGVEQLDRGEAEAISLAMSRGVVDILLDDRKGRLVAEKLGLTAIGTLGVIVRAAQLGFTHFDAAITTLQATNMRLSAKLIAEARLRL